MQVPRFEFGPGGEASQTVMHGKNDVTPLRWLMRGTVRRPVGELTAWEEPPDCACPTTSPGRAASSSTASVADDVLVDAKRSISMTTWYPLARMHVKQPAKSR